MKTNTNLICCFNSPRSLPLARAVLGATLLLGGLAACQKSRPAASAQPVAAEVQTSAVARGMMSAKPSLAACHGELGDTVTTTFTAKLRVDDAGQVADVSWPGEAPAEAHRACLDAALRGITFEAAVAGLTVNVEVEAPAKEDAVSIRDGVRLQLPAIKACYDTALVTSPGLAGTVMATFTIAPGGVVSQASAAGVEPALDACVADVIRNIRFALNNTSPIEVRAYPLALAPASAPVAP